MVVMESVISGLSDMELQTAEEIKANGNQCQKGVGCYCCPFCYLDCDSLKFGNIEIDKDNKEVTVLIKDKK